MGNTGGNVSSAIKSMNSMIGIGSGPGGNGNGSERDESSRLPDGEKYFGFANVGSVFYITFYILGL